MFYWLTLSEGCRWWGYNVLIVMPAWINEISTFIWADGSFFPNFWKHSKNNSNFSPSTYPLTLLLAQGRAAASLHLYAYSNGWSVIIGLLHSKIAIARINALLSETLDGEFQRAASHLKVQHERSLYKRPHAHLQQLPNMDHTATSLEGGECYQTRIPFLVFAQVWRCLNSTLG